MLFRLLCETAISGTNEAVPALERDYVQLVRAASTGREKVELYAAAITIILGRLAPLFRVLREAAPANPELAEFWHGISERRSQNMRLFASDIASTGAFRPGLELDDAADTVWAMNSPELYLLLVGERGWPPKKFEQWLADAWVRLLLSDESAG